MLNLNQIKQFYPQSESIPERNMLREYLQYKLLEAIFASRYGSKLSFIGGTAIRIIYGSDRFSEDLDFDNFGISQKDFAGLTKIAQKSLEKEGLSVETKTVFHEAYRSYLKITGILYDYKITGHREEKLVIQLDTTEQDFDFPPALKIINKFGIFAEIRVNPPEILLSQKIVALFKRKRLMGRDLYDITYLASLAKPNLDYLSKKLGSELAAELKTKILELLQNYQLENLAQDIKPFVNDPKKLETVRKFDRWIEKWEIK